MKSLVLKAVPSDKYACSKIVGTLNVNMKYAYEWKKKYGRALYHRFTIAPEGIEIELGSKWVANNRGGDLGSKAVEYVRDLITECSDDIGKDVVGRLPQKLIKEVILGKKPLDDLSKRYKVCRKEMRRQRLWLTLKLEIEYA